jgi:carbonic anhydrase
MAIKKTSARAERQPIRLVEGASRETQDTQSVETPGGHDDRRTAQTRAAGRKHAHKLSGKKTRSMTGIDETLRNNACYAAGFDKGDLPTPPKKRLAVVACMDARLDVHKILGLAEGDAHVIRNAGGVVTEDVLRSLLISQRLLGTREVLLLHHTDCGMLTFTDDQVREEVQREVGIKSPFALEAFRDLDQDVRQSMARILASPFIPIKDTVRGFVYDVRTETLREVERERAPQRRAA